MIIQDERDIQLRLRDIEEGEIFESKIADDTILIKTTEYELQKDTVLFACVCLETGIIYVISENEKVRAVNAKIIIR